MNPQHVAPVDAVITALEQSSLDFLAYVPSNKIAPIINRFRENQGAPLTFPVAREEEAVGIIGAANLVGRRGAILMQDNGFGNAMTALATWAVAYHVPLPILANTRGGLGEYNSMIHTFSAAVPQLLEAIRVPVFVLDRRDSTDDWRESILEAIGHAWMTHRPVVTLMDFWRAGRQGGAK